jgi:hypothetical protein
MDRRRLGMLLAGTVAVTWVGLSAQQEMQPRPGPGTGVMNVAVVNHPAVTAAQSGEWRMSVANVADVRVANTVATTLMVPRFVQTGRMYAITWATGEREQITVRELGEDGWIRVDQSPGSRWVNLGTARAIEDRR